MSVRKALVCGAAGFLGAHLERRLKEEGFYVVSVARKLPLYRTSVADEYNVLDLTNPPEFHHHFHRHCFDEVYQMASDGGGLGYIANSDNDSSVMTNSLKINLNMLDAIVRTGHGNKIFFASSQCVYPTLEPVDPFAFERSAPPAYSCRESDASFENFAFAQEKLFSEKLYDAYRRNHGLTIRIGRIGNTYGPYCTWFGDRAKAPAAICRKVVEASYAGTIDVWGDGSQIRSFTYVDDVIEGIRRLMMVDYQQPVNIASSESVTIAELLEAVCHTAGKIVAFKPTDGPIGVRARTSDNTLAKRLLGWEPTTPLSDGICKLYAWVRDQVLNQKVA
jgi:nucleoside-diphosphate-sugar epimerase